MRRKGATYTQSRPDGKPRGRISCYLGDVGQTLSPDNPRALCLRCRRPQAVCFCSAITEVHSRTRVVFVQHPLEAKVPISTCRMAHLSLPNSELHVELEPDASASLRARAAEPDTYLLFPSEGAKQPSELSAPPRNLIVVDGTWDNARKLLLRSPMLSRLPRLGLKPVAPGNYRIRKEPAEHCLATIEAVAQVLDAVERAPGRFTKILSAFDAMVERQLAFIAAHQGASRYQRLRRRNPGRSPVERLREVAPKLVLIFAEANAWPRTLEVGGYAELLHLAAIRFETGEQFEAVLKPRRELSPVAAGHLGVSAEALLNGEEVAPVLERFSRFVGDDTVATWGPYSLDLLRGEGLEGLPRFDLRGFLTQLFSRRPGAVEDCAAAIGATLPDAPRAVRRVIAMRAVVAELLRRKPIPSPLGEGARAAKSKSRSGAAAEASETA